VSAYYKMTTVHGYQLDEVVSSVQKLIRRGMADEAIWFAIEMNESGFGAYCWRRLLIIVSEDVGIGDPMAAPIVCSLWQMSIEIWKHDKANAADKERVKWNGDALLEAVWYLAHAAKSREMVDAYAVIEQRVAKGERMTIPDFARDQHTASGRAMGRGIDHFNEEGDKLEPLAEIDGNKWCQAWEAERPTAKDAAPSA
jgi:replication-associated recombination protein RarA